MEQGHMRLEDKPTGPSIPQRDHTMFGGIPWLLIIPVVLGVVLAIIIQTVSLYSEWSDLKEMPDDGIFFITWSFELPKRVMIQAPPPVDAEPGAIAPLEATWTWCGVTMWGHRLDQLEAQELSAALEKAFREELRSLRREPLHEAATASQLLLPKASRPEHEDEAELSDIQLMLLDLQQRVSALEGPTRKDER
eukprot:g20369.t1